MRGKPMNTQRAGSRLAGMALLATCLAGIGTAAAGVRDGAYEYQPAAERQERQDFEYGWVGILGLAGLLGMRKMRRTARREIS